MKVKKYISMPARVGLFLGGSFFFCLGILSISNAPSSEEFILGLIFLAMSFFGLTTAKRGYTAA